MAGAPVRRPKWRGGTSGGLDTCSGRIFRKPSPVEEKMGIEAIERRDSSVGGGGFGHMFRKAQPIVRARVNKLP
jgi:hypothetical protein